MEDGTQFHSSLACASRRLKLNLRLPWRGPSSRPVQISSTAMLREYRECPGLMSAGVLAEAASVLSGAPRHSLAHRRNLTNTSEWKRLVGDLRHWRRTGERHLRSLAVSLVQNLKPASQSSAPFFHAATFVEAVRKASFVLPGDFKLYRVPQEERSWWRGLASQLESKMPLQVSISQGDPCTLPRVLLDLLQADRLRFQANPAWHDPLGSEIHKLLASAQNNLACIAKKTRLLQNFMFKGAHLFFSLLDRLDCRLWSLVKTPLSTKPFWIRLLPTPFTEANVVRGSGRFHCDKAFQDLLQDRLGKQRPSGSNFRFVEVGASLGSCTFQVLTSLHDSVAVAVEPYTEAASAIQQTAAWNNLADRLVVRQAFVSDRTGTCQLYAQEHMRNPAWNFKPKDPADHAQHCNVTSLEEILCSVWGDFDTLDLLRVHVDGHEEAVLKSLKDRLHPELVKAVALAMWPYREEDETYDPAAVARFLRARGYELQLHFLTSSSQPQQLRNEDAILALQGGLAAADTMYLSAWHSSQKSAPSMDQKEVCPQIHASCLTKTSTGADVCSDGGWA